LRATETGRRQRASKTSKLTQITKTIIWFL
jgi:hypothetical protein